MHVLSVIWYFVEPPPQSYFAIGNHGEPVLPIPTSEYFKGIIGKLGPVISVLYQSLQGQIVDFEENACVEFLREKYASGLMWTGRTEV